MLSQNFMGLYDPRLGAGTPAPGQVPGQVPADPTRGASWTLPQQVRQPAAPAAQDPWALLQPKLDAYMNDWWAKKYASAFGQDTSRQEQGAGAGPSGSGQEFNGPGAGANRDSSFESGSAGFG